MENTNQANLTQNSPKPRTPAQIAASRANGAKSKGPVTISGLIPPMPARSNTLLVENAERHGIFARICTIQGEAPEHFTTLIADLYETWTPTDEHERALVDTMAMALWRRTRIAALESAGINLQLAKSEIQNPETTHHYLAITSLAEESRSFELLNRYEARFTRMYERAARSLMAYRKFRQQETAPSAPIPEHNPEPASFPEPEIQKQKNEPKPTHPPTGRAARRAWKLRAYAQKLAKQTQDRPSPPASTSQPASPTSGRTA